MSKEQEVWPVRPFQIDLLFLGPPSQKLGVGRSTWKRKKKWISLKINCMPDTCANIQDVGLSKSAVKVLTSCSPLVDSTLGLQPSFRSCRYPITSFRRAWSPRSCSVPEDGFWQTGGKVSRLSLCISTVRAFRPPELVLWQYCLPGNSTHTDSRTFQVASLGHPMEPCGLCPAFRSWRWWLGWQLRWKTHFQLFRKG